MIGKINPKKLTPNPHNPRFITDDKKGKLVESFNNLSMLQQFRPIIVDENLVVLGGNQRIDVALILKQKTVHYGIITQELVDQENAKAKAEGREEHTYKYYCDQIVITDNSEFGEYDHEMVKVHFGEYPLESWGYDVIEWGIEEDIEIKDDSDNVPQEEVETDIKSGDIIKIGHHTLVCGDSKLIETYSKLKANNINLLLTDPPYGVDYGKKNAYLNSNDNANRLEHDIEGDTMTVKETTEIWIKAFSNAIKCMSDKASFYIYIPSAPELYISLTQAIISTGLMPKHTLIWVKNNHVLGMSDYNYKHEAILYGWKKKGTHQYEGRGEQKTTVWEYDKPLANKLHPTMKPIDMLSNAILNSSKPGDKILDVFGGSGSTMISAHQSGRICYMIEQKPSYCQVIINRMIKLDNDLSIRINNQIYHENI